MSFEKCLRKANSNKTNVFVVVLSGKSDGDRTGIGRAEHLEKAHVVKKQLCFSLNLNRTGNGRGRTGNGRERTGNGRVGICFKKTNGVIAIFEC